MKQTQKQILFCLIVSSSFLLWQKAEAACVGPEQSAVQAAVAAAEIGDTVTVCDGDVTWVPTTQGYEPSVGARDTFLYSTKAIKLVGGTGTIKFSGNTNYGGIVYRPDANSVGHTFEFTGFTLDGENKTFSGSGLVLIKPSVYDQFFDGIKIHHNTFKNISAVAVMVENMVYGVTYLNTFTNVNTPTRETSGGVEADGGAWAVISQTHGTETNHFVEDNLINLEVGSTFGEIGGTDPGHGAPGIVYRYNTVDMSAGTLTGQTSLWGAHGLQSMHISYFLTGTATGGSATTLVDSTKNFVNEGVVVGDTVIRGDLEGQTTIADWQVTSISTTINENDTIHFTSKTAFSVGDSYHISHYLCPNGCGYSSCSNTIGVTPTTYGSCDGDDPFCNRISTVKEEWYGNKVNAGNTYFVPWVNPRGGASLIFDNYLIPRIGVSLESYYHITYAQYVCNTCAKYGAAYYQVIANSYNWANYSATTLQTMQKNLDGCADAVIGGYVTQKNVDYWNHNPDYNGTTERGVYCGPTLPTNCVVGDGAWITNQSCTDVTSFSGAKGVGLENRANNISGTLYKCASANHWEEYYTPYAYPHPLRGTADTTAPASPTGLSVS